MSLERRLGSLEARVGRRSPILYSEVQAAELRLGGGLSPRERIMSDRVFERPDYPGREADETLVRTFYAQYSTGRDVRAEFTAKIDKIAERLRANGLLRGEDEGGD